MAASMNKKPDHEDERVVLSGDYIYLHPWWYAWDTQDKLQLVGMPDIRPNLNSFKLGGFTEEYRLGLEIMAGLSLDEKLEMGIAEMHSIMVFTSNPAETPPFRLFHPGSHVIVEQHLYKVDKKDVLRPVAPLPCKNPFEAIHGYLKLMNVPGDCDLYIDHEAAQRIHGPFGWFEE
jgi:hypothetical protein